jgi:hypothetical protein
MVGKGSKEGITGKSQTNGLSLVPCPHTGERGQGRAIPSYPSHSHPCGQAKKKKELADKLRKVER